MAAKSKQRKPAVKPKYQGLHADRYEREPLEAKFALAWQKINDEALRFNASQGWDHLDVLLAENSLYPRDPSSPRDRLVAATVIQWLGSPIGQFWLAEVLGKDKP